MNSWVAWALFSELCLQLPPVSVPLVQSCIHCLDSGVSTCRFSSFAWNWRKTEDTSHETSIRPIRVHTCTTLSLKSKYYEKCQICSWFYLIEIRCDQECNIVYMCYPRKPSMFSWLCNLTKLRRKKSPHNHSDMWLAADVSEFVVGRPQTQE